jgi:tRNA A58 N-methylase Trm61
MNTAPVYVMGHADLEIERLQLQASIIAGVTQRLIQECGIRPGMRVLDLGCGAGDVSMLLVEAVGDAGSVVAIDHEPRAIEIARARDRGWLPADRIRCHIGERTTGAPAVRRGDWSIHSVPSD